MTVSAVDIIRVLPEIVLVGFGLLIMIADPFTPRREKSRLGGAALVGAVAALASTLLVATRSGSAFGGLLVVDGFSLFLRFLFLAILILTILASFRYLEREGINHSEYYALLLFGTVGMNLMVSANELVMVFLGLEISSLATYVLVGFRRGDLRSNESAVKYFLLGSFATAFFLYGIALLYGATGTTRLPEMGAELGGMEGSLILVLMGVGLLFVGLAFKVATAPFQVWTPDVYQGAPTPITGFLSSGPKAAALAAFLRIFLTALGPLADTWFWLLWASAILTMVVGNLGALVQTNVKRMLAYSSIAHVGYMVVAVAARSELGLVAVLFYVVAYAFMKLGAFTVVMHLGEGELHQEIDDYAGLHGRQPWLAASLTVFLLSLIGIPLTGGFLGKLYVFTAALEAKLLSLVILGVLMSALSATYYLRVVKAMYMQEARASQPTRPVPASLTFVLTITTLGTLYLGLVPDSVLRFAQASLLPLP